MKSSISRVPFALLLLALAPVAFAQAVPCKFVSKADPTQCTCPLGDGVIPDPAVPGGFLVTQPAQSGTCTIGATVLPLLPAGQPMFVYELPQPIFYEPDTATFPGTDYYEIAMKEVTQIGVAFPQPVNPAGVACPAQPAGTQFLGLRDALGCALFTPVWGYGQTNNPAYPLNGIATYPSMSFRGERGRPVKVKWVNDLASPTHLFCPDPRNSDAPCGIDRTLMGTLRKKGEPVNEFGTIQQPDNAMVVHLHGGEIPPDSDGFAELWIGNAATAAAYGPRGPYYTMPEALRSYDWTTGTYAEVPGVTANVDPHFFPPPGNAIATDAAYPAQNADPAGSTLASVYAPAQLQRPLGNSIFYNYPMVQEPATIWYHDHTLGKTRVNVAAGPAGYFYVTDPAVEGPLYASGALPPQGDCSNAGILAGACYDVPVVLQDRAFNADGSINFPNGLAQPVIPGILDPLAPGPNPDVHPQWVPEYFGDVAVVNGTIWPKLSVEPRPYRFRLLDGSNARCYTMNLKVKGLEIQPQIHVIGSDQGYLPAAASVNKLDICPGERYDVVVDFSALAGQRVFLENSGGAPFPNGAKPNQGFPFLAQLMTFDVVKPLTGAPVAWGPGPLVPSARLPQSFPGQPPAPGVALYRQMILNEVLDPVTLAPVKVQIDGRRFEDPVEEFPKRDTVEVWSFVNTTVDAHPIHLHLVQFQVVGRQKFDAQGFARATGLATPGAERCPQAGPIPCWNKLPIEPFLVGQPRRFLPVEAGFKDTVVAFPGEVTTVVALWKAGWSECAPGQAVTGAGTACRVPAADASAPYWEPVTSGPYVWHCHIVDHEDNEMMRPSLVVP
jgi:FtsP/CotA-like multicopper oxidase with cupredoxin domain